MQLGFSVSGSKWLRIAGAIAAIGLVVLFALSRPHESVTSAARKVLVAEDAGDADTVWRYLHPEEKRLIGLTPENFAFFLHQFSDRHAHFHREGGIDFKAMANDGVLASATYRLDTGEDFPLLIDVLPTPDGPKAVVTWGLWEAIDDIGEKHATASMPAMKAMFTRTVDGLPQLQKALKPQGIEGYCIINDGITMESFDSLLARAKRGLKTAIASGK